MFANVAIKRLTTVLILLTFFLGLGFDQAKKVYAWSSLDQFTVSADGYWRIQTHQIIGQTFRPTYNKLDGVGVYAGIQPSGPGNCMLTVSVYRATTLPPVKIAEAAMPITKEETYNIVDIGPVDMIPDGRYEMRVTASSPYAYWLVNSSNIYARGSAIIDSVTDSSQDFVFATFGYNDTPPEESSPPPTVDIPDQPTGGDASTDSAEEQSTSAGSSSSVSTSILAPSGLTAQIITEGGSSSINLSWTASKTADVTGYSVLRSTEENSGFIEIGATDKKTLSYRDDKAVTDQTYYYVVRAYKDGKISKNSNTASAKISDTTAPAKPENFKITSQNENEIVFSWDKSADTDLANYILTVADSNNTDATPIETIETISKDETTYTLKFSQNTAFAKDTEYYFYLQAKDVSNNFSEKAETTGKFEVDTKSSNTLIWIISGAALLLVATVIVFVYLKKRKGRKMFSRIK